MRDRGDDNLRCQRGWQSVALVEEHSEYGMGANTERGGRMASTKDSDEAPLPYSSEKSPMIEIE